MASAYWSFIGTLSKVVELGDTAFLILRKKPVMFLHWYYYYINITYRLMLFLDTTLQQIAKINDLILRYHHATVMLYTWYTYEDSDPCHRWFIVMNYFVHTVMYTYYGLRVRWISKINYTYCIFNCPICHHHKVIFFDRPWDLS